jgi:molybdopterin synthase catalytic subunit
MIKIVKEKINIEEVLDSVGDPSVGGTDVFIGTTRNHSHGKAILSLEYEAYEPMASKLLDGLETEAHRRWPLKKIMIVHRVGKIEIGEASVVIAVSSIHRKEAFEACRYLIDTLKKSVPIWKKEVFADGEEWVGAQEQ